jgi:FecR protein
MSQKTLLFLASLLLSTSAVGTAGAAQAGPINWAQVIKLVNKVQFKPTNAAWRPAQGRDRLQQSGEALFTSRGSRADLRLSEGSLLRMSSNTHLWIQPNSRNLLQRSGTALYVIKPGGGSTLISTPYGRAGVRGSALFVRVNEQTGTMIVGALTNNPTGDMEVTTDNGPKQLLKAGQMAVVRDGKITTFEFDLNTFYQTSSLVQGFGLDGKPIVDADGTLADPEVQATLAAVQAETLPALAAQAPVTGSNVAVNPEFLNSSPRDLKPADLVMQATTGGFDRNSPQTAAGFAAVRQGINPPPAAVPATTTVLPAIPPVVPAAAPPVGAATGTIVPLPQNPAPTVVNPPAPTIPAPTVVNPPAPVIPAPTIPTPTVVEPGRTPPNNTPAIPVNPPIGQPNNPQLPVIQPIAQPNQPGSVSPTPITQPNQPGSVSPTPITQPNQPGSVTPPIRIEIRVEVKEQPPRSIPTPTIPTPTIPTPVPANQPVIVPVVSTPPTSGTAPISLPTTPTVPTPSIPERTIAVPITPGTTKVALPTTVAAPPIVPTIALPTPNSQAAPPTPIVEPLPVVTPIVPVPVTATPIVPIVEPLPVVTPIVPVPVTAAPIVPIVEPLPVVTPIVPVPPTPVAAPIVPVTPAPIVPVTPAPIVPVTPAPTPVIIPDRAIPTVIPATLPTTPDPTLTVPQ